jgi:PAS domain S-box-containing protein/AhpD family alkylhydroperoxidase
LFAPACSAPDVLEGLWRQTLTAYLDNPLPALFKERLFAYLSRLRSCGYCLVCHSCQLRELGSSGHEIFGLLEPLLAADPPSAAHLLGSAQPLAQLPCAGSRAETRIIALAAHAFVKDDVADACRAELRRLLGQNDYAWLIVLLSHINACHDWVRAHPEIEYQDDERVQRHLQALVDEEPRLSELFDRHGRANVLARRDHLAAIVDSADDAIVGETLDGTIVSWNRAAQRLYGYSAEMVHGMSIAMLVPADRSDETTAIMERIRRGERGHHIDTVRVGIDGERLDVSLTISPVRNASGALTGASSIARHVGDRKLRERYVQIVHHATRVLARSGTIEETLPAVLRVIGEGMDWAVGAAWMPTLQRSTAHLRCTAFWHANELVGASFETASRQLRLGAGEGLPGRVWETGQARWVADVTAEPHSRRADEAQQDGLHTCYLLPVRGRLKVVAVIEFLSDEIRPPDPIVLEMLNRLSGQISEFLENKGAAAGGDRPLTSRTPPRATRGSPSP